jgi:hypothetical protein
VFGSQSCLLSRTLSSAHHSRFAVCSGAWVMSHALAAWYTHQHSLEVKRVDMSRCQSSQLGWWLCMMLVKSSITACGPSEYAGGCCHQFRWLVVVKGWYTYCMCLASYDPSAWGNGGPGAWHREHRATAGVSATLLVSLPEFGDLPQWLISFSRAKSKGGHNKGAVGGGLAPMPSPFHWGPPSWTQVSRRLVQ